MRIDCEAVLPEATRALRELEDVVGGSGIEPRLLELVRMRASQLNNCAYCLDMHSKDARALGEDEQRLHLLAAWRDAHVYTSTGANGAGMVRGIDAASRTRSVARGVLPAQSRVQPTGDRRPHAGHHRHQRVESLRARFPVACRQLCLRPAAPRAL